MPMMKTKMTPSMNKSPTTAGAADSSSGREPSSSDNVGNAAFIFYCLFIVSYFLHLGARVPPLGAVRIDILLCGLAIVLNMAAKKPEGASKARSAGNSMRSVSKLLLVLVIYIVVSLPFVRWPGSVIGHGWEPFLKSILFFMLTITTVTTEKRLKIFLCVFLAVQTFRVLEPLWMHITTGYWGSFTNMGNYELMDRLSGSPFDIVNPNGLAFVIIVVISLCHHILLKGSTTQKLLYFVLLAPLLYAMVLTGSRSGVSVLVLFALMAVWNSKRRVLVLSVLAVAVAALLASMSPLERQRYLSIVDHSAKGGATAEGRITGMWTDLEVGMRRPIFGHGLGTSLEANANATGEALPSHTLYTEVLQELGLIGLSIFLWFIVETCKNCLVAVKDARKAGGFLLHAAESSRDFGIVLVVFSLASYGLNEYQWYLLAALSVLLRDLSRKSVEASGTPIDATAEPAPRRPRIGERPARLSRVRAQ
jgi:putative inorganic carbon (HCO3(-)) transporter